MACQPSRFPPRTTATGQCACSTAWLTEAWLLTAATVAFNGAAAWPDPLGVGMHAVMPVLFVVVVEAARHAIGRIADITARKHMEGVGLSR